MLLPIIIILKLLTNLLNFLISQTARKSGYGILSRKPL